VPVTVPAVYFIYLSVAIAVIQLSYIKNICTVACVIIGYNIKVSPGGFVWMNESKRISGPYT
jgi:hypothetical protein